MRYSKIVVGMIFKWIFMTDCFGVKTKDAISIFKLAMQDLYLRNFAIYQITNNIILVITMKDIILNAINY